MATFSGGFCPVSAQKVVATEQRLGVELPADYKRFLCTINGGCPSPYYFPVPDCGGAYADFLFGIAAKRVRNDLEYQQAELVDPLPPGYIWIGRDPGSNLLVLTTLGKSAGRVLFVDRGGFWVREPGVNTFQVTASFTEFIEGLRERPTDIEPRAA